MDSRPEADTPVTQAYRIVSRKYPPFDGAGAYRWGSRWVSPGRWVVHAAETYALAVLENLVHWQSGSPPPAMVCVQALLPTDLKQERLDTDVLDAGGDYQACRVLGDDWYDRGESAVFWVPSVVSPYEGNVLFNQRHPDFSRIEVSKPIAVRIDSRLL